MKAVMPATLPKTQPFPESAIRNQMTQFWNEKVAEQADNPFTAERKNTLYEVLPDIDSLEVVKFMLRIEETIDIEIPPKFIKRGGYDSCDEMIRHLMPQLRTLYTHGIK
jgi:acyl carrier protein